MLVVPQQFRSKCLPNRSVFSGSGGENFLGHQIREYCQKVVLFAPVHLVGSHPYLVVEAQPQMRRLYVGEEHPPHPRVALSGHLSGKLQGHLAHRGLGEGLELLVEVLDAHRPGPGQTVHLAVVATASSRQGSNDNALYVEDIPVSPPDRFGIVITGHCGPGSRTLLRPQRVGLLYLQHEDRGACFQPQLHHRPCLCKPS